MSKALFFESVGGRNVLVNITKVFYDKVYKHPWIKQYFEAIPQEHIENQQIDFMQKVLGGENIYVGKTPATVHNHMFIPEELFELRNSLLKEAFTEVDCHPELVEKWLEIEDVFKRKIINQSPSECTPRFKTDSVLNFSKPHN